MKANKNITLNQNQLSKDTICFKISHESILGKQFVVVPEGWEVLVVQNGQLGRILKRGSHKVSTLLKNKAQIQLVFYPTLSEISILWGTPQKMAFHDEVFNLPIEIGANGSLNFKIKNIRKFYFSFSSFDEILPLQQIKERLSPVVVDNLHKAISTFAKEQNKSFLQLNLQQAVDKVNAQLNYSLLNQFGLSLEGILIKGIIFDKDKLKKLEKESQQLMQNKANNQIQSNKIQHKDTPTETKEKEEFVEVEENKVYETIKQAIDEGEQEEGLMLLS